MESPGFLAGAKSWLYRDAGIGTCPGCGFDWSMLPADALTAIAERPPATRSSSKGATARSPPTTRGTRPATSGTSPIWRGWSERWVVLGSEPGTLLAGWDPDELAAARNYRGMPTVSALWALSTCTATLVELSRDLDHGTQFLHGDWGVGTVGEALVWLAHEYLHHQGDVDAAAGPRT
ncbi:MAG: hypothetical protein M5T61_00685 [Acidimicrobiia bacterium]|nr:hypothetical protein [Acidimicrobiia bacterium]